MWLPSLRRGGGEAFPLLEGRTALAMRLGVHFPLAARLGLRGDNATIMGRVTRRAIFVQRQYAPLHGAVAETVMLGKGLVGDQICAVDLAAFPAFDCRPSL